MSGATFTGLPGEAFAAFARRLRKVDSRLPPETEKALRDIGKQAVRKAKGKIGVYQDDYVTPHGEWFPQWAQLSPNTLNGGRSPSGFYYPGKIELGYAPPDNPLLREGTLRASISFSLSGTYHAQSVILGSTDKVMVWQEFGTTTIPPRSVIGAAMAETVQEYGLKRFRTMLETVYRG